MTQTRLINVTSPHDCGCDSQYQYATLLESDGLHVIQREATTMAEALQASSWCAWRCCTPAARQCYPMMMASFAHPTVATSRLLESISSDVGQLLASFPQRLVCKVYPSSYQERHDLLHGFKHVKPRFSLSPGIVSDVVT